MNDKYIIYFISRTKANMIKFIENKLKENEKSIKLKKAENLIKENFDIKIINEEEFLSIIE